ncbi:MAG: O-antigen ligase family protein [Pseudomonadota bacterium]
MNLARAFAAMHATRDDALSHPVAVGYVALTVLIMAYSALFPVVPILVFLVLWLSLLLVKGPQLLRPTRATLWVMALPALSMLSSLWSDYPGRTLYLGAAFMGMMLCVLIIARTVRFAALAQGLVLGCVATLLITLYANIYDVDFTSGTVALIGYFGSKNTVGFVAQVGVITSMVLLISSHGWVRRCLLGLVPLLFSAGCLYASRSSSSLVSLAVVMGAMLALYALVRIKPARRWAAIRWAGLLMAAMLVLGTQLGGQDALLKALGKDATLTGRTYLWQEGMQIGLERPLLGHGYGAFWVQGQPQAERYWREFHIASRGGFHFHSSFVQSFVDLGAAGLAVTALLIVLNLYGTLRLALRQDMAPEAALLVGFAVMFAVRALVEVDAGGPFGLGVLLFYSILPRLALTRQEP